jgi:hypothetical protein
MIPQDLEEILKMLNQEIHKSVETARRYKVRPNQMDAYVVLTEIRTKILEIITPQK